MLRTKRGLLLIASLCLRPLMIAPHTHIIGRRRPGGVPVRDGVGRLLHGRCLHQGEPPVPGTFVLLLSAHRDGLATYGERKNMHTFAHRRTPMPWALVSIPSRHGHARPTRHLIIPRFQHNLQVEMGIRMVFICCAVLAAVGFGWTVAFVDDTPHESLEKVHVCHICGAAWAMRVRSAKPLKEQPTDRSTHHPVNPSLHRRMPNPHNPPHKTGREPGAGRARGARGGEEAGGHGRTRHRARGHQSARRFA